jgi:hypothetical protein
MRVGRELAGEGRHATRERIEERAGRAEKSMAGGMSREGASAGCRASGRHPWRGGWGRGIPDEFAMGGAERHGQAEHGA